MSTYLWKAEETRKYTRRGTEFSPDPREDDLKYPSMV
jgi:hypothetical protein